VSQTLSDQDLLMLLAGLVGSEPREAPVLTAALDRAQAARLVTLARHHRVEAWLAGTLDLSDPRWQELAAQRPRFLADQVRTLATVRDLGSSLDAFSAPWLVIKGPALAHRLYPNVGLRHYVDLDVLVGPAWFGKVLEHLEGQGYRTIDRNWPLIESLRPGEIRMRGPRGVLIDLHWSLFNAPLMRQAFRWSTSELLATRTVVEPPGLPVLAAEPELAHLGLHAALSGANALVWLLDLHLAAMSVSDWSRTVPAVRALAAGPALALTLGRARRLFGTPVPGEVLRDLAGGLAWRATLASVDRNLRLPVSPSDPSASRLLARSARRSSSRSAAAVARNGLTWVASGARRRYVAPSWTDSRSPDSALYDVRDDQARERYLEMVGNQA
jgi:hypothetical protein